MGATIILAPHLMLECRFLGPMACLVGDADLIRPAANPNSSEPDQQQRQRREVEFLNWRESKLEGSMSGGGGPDSLGTAYVEGTKNR